MLTFKDFVPQQIEPGGFLRKAVYEHFEAAVDEADQWIREHGIDLINVETVLLPNLWNRDEEGSGDASIWTSGESSSTWHQVVRVWYRD